MQGDPVTQLRAQVVLKTNWFKGKIDYIRDLLLNAEQTDSIEEIISSLEFRNDEEIAKTKPTKSNPREVPFIKNNPREKELLQIEAAKVTDGEGQSA